MGEGSLSADDIDALLSGAMDDSPGDSSGGGSSSDASDDFNFLSGGDDSSAAASSGGGVPSADDIMAALGPAASAPAPSPVQKQPKSQVSSSTNLNLLREVTLTLSVEFGRTTMLVKDVLNLSEGKIVELDRAVGEDLDILVNGKVIGKGKIIVIDGFYGIRITEIVDESRRIHM